MRNWRTSLIFVVQRAKFLTLKHQVFTGLNLSELVLTFCGRIDQEQRHRDERRKLKRQKTGTVLATQSVTPRWVCAIE